MISQTENPQLKNMLKQMRNQCEASQEEIYQIARARQYYVPAAQAAPDEIQHVRQLIFSRLINQHLKDALRIVWYFVLPHLRCHFGRVLCAMAHSILALKIL